MACTCIIGTRDLYSLYSDDNSNGNTFILDCEYSVSRKMKFEDIHSVADELHNKANEFFRDSIFKILCYKS